MKKLLLAAILASGLAGRGQALPADSIRMVIDSSITLLRTYALHRDRPDWEGLRAEVYALSGSATRFEDLGPVAARLFEGVDDHHGWLAAGDTLLQWPRVEMPGLNEAIRLEFAKGNRIVRRLLPGAIGYLRVPGMMADTAAYDALAQRLADSLYALDSEGARSFIIDLRLNAGGTMFPMIAGLSPLLGNGAFIGNADCRGKVLDMTKLKDGCFSSTDGGKAAVRPGRRLDRVPVVVLTGHGTGSAGECVAVAFRGRPGTWFIGEPTAGYTTGNNGHWIIAGRVGIVMAESVLTDRSGKAYQHALVPDEWVPGGDDFSEGGQDAKIAAAIRWLKKK